jgi:hypothetical protein
MQMKPEFRVRLNGVCIPEIRVQRAPDGGLEIAVRDAVIGWFVITNDCILEYRDETSWAMLPICMRQESIDKGWYRTTPQELIEVLRTARVIQ